MNSVSSIALSSMTYASQRLARSAHNVANVNTDGFQAKEVVAREVPQGGVTSVTRPTGGAPAVYQGDDGSAVLGSNTDLISETVGQLSAMHQFKASVALLKTDQEMMKSLLDVKA